MTVLAGEKAETVRSCGRKRHSDSNQGRETGVGGDKKGAGWKGVENERQEKEGEGGGEGGTVRIWGDGSEWGAWRRERGQRREAARGKREQQSGEPKANGAEAGRARRAEEDAIPERNRTAGGSREERGRKRRAGEGARRGVCGVRERGGPYVMTPAWWGFKSSAWFRDVIASCVLVSLVVRTPI